MALRGLPSGKYKPLTEQEVLQIHKASMRVFEETGVEVHDDLALKFLKEAGAEVDMKRKKFYASEAFVMDKVKKAPSQVTLCGRDPKHDLILGGKNVYLGTGGTALNVLDIETGIKRPTVLQDVRNTAKLVDALDHIHFFVLPVYPSELSQENVDVNRFFAGMSNTSKHVMGGVYSSEGIKKVVKIGQEIMGSKEALRKRPIFSMITCIMSPLKLDAKYTELMLTAIEAGVPVATPAAPIAGMTSPMTLAGTLVQVNVEALSGIIMTQCVSPGTPVLLSYVPTTADIRTMAFTFSAVENGMMNAAGAQMAHFYDLPMYATAGLSDSKLPDVQAGYEKMSTSMMAALAGCNYIHDAAGLIEAGMSVAYEQYVIDDEINGMIMRAVRGIEVDEDTLAVDVIKEVGPGGDYLTQPHTIQYMRTENYLPQVADRNMHDSWQALGAQDGRTKANGIAKRILADHTPLPIDQAVVQKLEEEIPELITK